MAFSENMNFTFTRVFFIFYPFMASMFLRAKPPKTIRMHLCRDFNLLYVMLLDIRIPIPFFLAVRKYFILLPAFYQIMGLMKSPKNFEKIAILKKWQLIFFWVVITEFGKISLKRCIFRNVFSCLFQYCPSNIYCSY